MDLSNLKPAEGSTKDNTRLGRGQGSGKGGTASRGHKGQKSRSGYSKKIGFEGGQMPLQRRVPKYGFKNVNRKEYRGINLDILQTFAEAKKLTSFNLAVFVENGLASKNDLVKVLGRGDIKAKLNIEAHAFSAKAKEAIEKAGGSISIIDTTKSIDKPTKPKAETKKEAKAQVKETVAKEETIIEEAPKAAVDA